MGTDVSLYVHAFGGISVFFPGQVSQVNAQKQKVILSNNEPWKAPLFFFLFFVLIFKRSH